MSKVTVGSESKFLLLNQLGQALQEDPDLADIEQPLLSSVFQLLFVSTGCDYISSFFARMGKATFLNTLAVPECIVYNWIFNETSWYINR